MWTEKSVNDKIEANQPLCGEVRRMVPPPEILKERNFKCEISVKKGFLIILDVFGYIRFYKKILDEKLI